MKCRLCALGLLAAGSVLVILTGCQRPFTKDRFDLITVGVDDRTDVRQMVGEPTADLSDQWFYDDLKRHYSAVIFFDEDGKVIGKRWCDAVTGQIEGRNPHANEPPSGEVREQHKKTTRIDED